MLRTLDIGTGGGHYFNDVSWNMRSIRCVGTPELLVRPRSDGSNGPLCRVGIVDCEATSTDPERAELFDLALAIVEVDANGVIVSLTAFEHAQRDPGKPIPADVVRITRVTDAMVAGKQLDHAHWESLLCSCDYLVAHNAAYDAILLERLLPNISGARWACSMTQIDWTGHGFDGRNLGYLLMQAGFYNSAHRASADVITLLHLLSWAEDFVPVMHELLTNADKDSLLIGAYKAPYSSKTVLRDRGYRWNAIDKIWMKEVDLELAEIERRWLYHEAGCISPLIMPVNARQRFRRMRLPSPR
ncbi:hypothetical protein IP81_07425 [Novosphingobium sp. AAP83]|nr:hypothetical protein IP81_07425 [Novosphingobium sp. AAP83]